MVKVLHYKRFKGGDDICFHDHDELGPLLDSCRIKKSGTAVLLKWADSVGIHCPCQFVYQIPLILINNPYYFPVVVYDADVKKFDLIAAYPLLDFFSSCINDGRISFLVVEKKEGGNSGDQVEGYFTLDSNEVTDVTFGEVAHEDSQGQKGSDYTLVFNIQLTDGRKTNFIAFMQKETDSKGLGQGENEDITPFTDAFKEDTHE